MWRGGTRETLWMLRWLTSNSETFSLSHVSRRDVGPPATTTHTNTHSLSLTPVVWVVRKVSTDHLVLSLSLSLIFRATSTYLNCGLITEHLIAREHLHIRHLEFTLLCGVVCGGRTALLVSTQNVFFLATLQLLSLYTSNRILPLKV